ncbi:hypothetical protein N5C93_15115 [Pseudomonas nitroreducens]|uniref:hypothetical protein n=1 Tax=Pseudomonas TaxID=286 RepID=UPI0007EE829A|nr:MULTISPECIES: hypothetical protein [Pseudomonas]MCJ1877965.1 hypothetical protein [Pseudomonas nitroreducens]MCJ1894362.1 hypothetical protein [Pseudomonas nitroreducens]MDG9854990.1 hypothetical protein [Pseudomonas nitroreducens]MDH1074169.1 hypothetical protein [Pseudomonas nitroreducens]NMZ73747.1 hypothetical protein [Pseudomonas nitroreducens]
MRKSTLLLLIGALAVLLGGSSCGGHNDRHDAPPRPPMDDGEMGYQRIPQQQIQPQGQSIAQR